MNAWDVELLPASPVPLYHQVAEQLQAAIDGGRLRRGDFLPSELDLAAAWGVSRPTARQAIQRLVDKGLLVRRRGVGTQVVSATVRRPVRLTSLYDDLAEQDRKPTTEVIVHAHVTADSDVAQALGVPEGTGLLHLERLRRARGAPLALLRNWVLLEVAPDLEREELEVTGLYEALRRRGVRPTTATQVIGAASATRAEAAP